MVAISTRATRSRSPRKHRSSLHSEGNPSKKAVVGLSRLQSRDLKLEAKSEQAEMSTTYTHVKVFSPMEQ